ncbi:hypothetical protein ACFX1T_009682 [Malus domestica]
MDKFCYAELTKAAENFKEELGRGTSRAEYKGVLADEGVVAVKKLKIYIKGKMCFRQRNFELKIADFGLAKSTQRGSLSSMFSQIRGTKGYIIYGSRVGSEPSNHCESGCLSLWSGDSRDGEGHSTIQLGTREH